MLDAISANEEERSRILGPEYQPLREWTLGINPVNSSPSNIIVSDDEYPFAKKRKVAGISEW